MLFGRACWPVPEGFDVLGFWDLTGRSEYLYWVGFGDGRDATGVHIRWGSGHVHKKGAVADRADDPAAVAQW